MFVIATDLDRTLFPNGKQEYDGSMSVFQQIVERYKPRLFYVTGRNIEEVKTGIAEYETPRPDYAVCEVGTRIYRCDKDSFSEDEGWIEHIEARTANWDIAQFKKALSEIGGIRPQEDSRQNRFKLSYYIENPRQDDSRSETAGEIIRNICPDATVVYSVDETHNMGLLDILPHEATKVAGLEYLRKREKLAIDDVVYSGDSGNDLLPLTFGYKAILVRNAIQEVREKALKISAEKGIGNKLYMAQGTKKLNGHYVSGIIEGLIHFGLISGDELQQ